MTVNINLVPDENRDDEPQKQELSKTIKEEERNNQCTPKRERTWKELQANNAAVVKMTAKWKQQRTKSNDPKLMMTTERPTSLRQSSRTNINVICTNNIEPESAIPPKCITSPSPCARREFLAKKGHLLGNRGAAYALSLSSGISHTTNSNNPIQETKPSKQMDMNTFITKVRPRPLESEIVKLDLAKKDPVPITAVISNTSLSTIKLLKANIKQKKLETMAKKAEMMAEAKKLESPMNHVNTIKMDIAASVAKKYTWETKTKPDTPKPNKTASKAMSFRNAKLKDNSRSTTNLVGMITPNSTKNVVEVLQEQTQPTVPLNTVPAFRKNPFGVPGSEVISALKKIQRRPSKNGSPLTVPVQCPLSLTSPTTTKYTPRRWSATTKLVTSSSQDTSTPIFPPAIARERAQLLLSPTSRGYGNMRRNRDNRTAQMKLFDEYKSSIVSYRMSQSSSRPNHYLDENLHLRGGFGKNGVSIFVRKRPIFDYEWDRGDFDVLSAKVHKDHDTVALHICQMQADTNQQLVESISFPCSAAFDEVCSNEELYQHVARPLVNLAVQGGLATIIMYGQTGSGKIFTMNGIEERICQDLFQNLPTRAKVSIQFVELSGKLCGDLLEDGPVKVVDQACGSVRLLNAATVHVATPMELSRALARGKQRRASAVTARNGVSSRSHAICQITVHFNSKRGSLTLIDLAGSEHRNNSLYHTQERQIESSEVNASLWALKECIRARASGCEKGALHVPYSSSNLTRILREPLEREDSQLCVIATVAPNASNTESTLETLKTLASFVGNDHFSENEHTGVPSTPVNNVIAPKEWDQEKLLHFLKTKKCIENTFVMPLLVDGRTIMRMNTMQIKMNFFEGKRDADERAVKLFRCIRTESDRVTRLHLKQQMAGPTK